MGGTIYIGMVWYALLYITIPQYGMFLYLCGMIMVWYDEGVVWYCGRENMGRYGRNSLLVLCMVS